MTITAKTSTIRTALSNALAALVAAKPGPTMSVLRFDNHRAQIEGTRSAPFPLCALSADDSTCLLHLVGAHMPGGTERSDYLAMRSERDRVQADKDAIEERLSVAQRHLDEQARATVAIVEEDQRKLTHLQGQLAEAHSEIRALTKSLDGVARQPQRQPAAQPVPSILAASPMPVSVAMGRSLLDEIAHATTAVAQQEAPATKLELIAEATTAAVPIVHQAEAPKAKPTTIEPITIAFPECQQGKTLAKAGENVQSLKSAGFRFIFTDRKDLTKGGHWEAKNTETARALAEKIRAALS